MSSSVDKYYEDKEDKEWWEAKRVKYERIKNFIFKLFKF